MSITTAVYPTSRGPRIGLYVCGERTGLTALEAEDLMSELADRIEECKAEQREHDRERIRAMRNEYEDRKAVQNG